jgi:hypothetical protein
LTLDKGRLPAPRPRPDLAASRNGATIGGIMNCLKQRDECRGGGNDGLNRWGYAVPHQRVPAAGSVLVIGIRAYVFISILGRVEATADPPATSYVDANSIMLG